ncbi:MAG: tyrosine-type recombinase/integrase [Burkholderiales bacterium]
MSGRANAMSNAALAAKWRGADRWLSDGGSRGAGRLVAKIGQGGATFYFAYFDTQEKRRFLPIGPFDPSGTRGISLQRARDRAAELSAIYRGGTPSLHEHFERQREAEERAHKAAQEAARREQEAALRGTLRQLLDAYTAHLVRMGKQSAGDVRRIFKRHVYQAAPDMAARKAAEIPVDDFVGLIGKVAEAEKGRTAAKLRSYLRAAYSLAIRSKTDPAAPMTLRTFGIDTNPIASIGALAQFNRARDRNLSAEELQAFLQRLEKVPAGVKKDAVQLCLLLGGQRPAQLLRARPVDVDLSAGTLTLYDPKGSRRQPRPHVLPLTKKAAGILAPRLKRDDEEEEEGEARPFVFTSDGQTGMRPETIAGIVAEISESMVKAKEAREGFELRDLRRTCETMLAALGVSSDVRAQLQSHGLGGVQQRHYDRHEYMAEKRAVLELWQRHLDRLLTGKSAKVVPMRRVRG